MIRIDFATTSHTWAEVRRRHQGRKVTVHTDTGKSFTGTLWPWANSGEGETVDLFSLTVDEDGNSVHIGCDTVVAMDVE